MKPSRSMLVLSAAFGLLCFGPILLPVLALLPQSLPFLALHLNKPKFASVFYGTSWTLAVLLCCALLAAVLPIWVAGVLTVFGLFFLSFGLAITRFRPKVPIGTAIFSPIVAIGLIFPAGRLSTLLLGEQVDQISVSEANAHPDAAWFTFTDATLDADHAYSRLVTWKRKKHRSAGQRVDHIAPLIYPGWTPAQPVTAWAFCDSESHTCPDWNKTVTPGVCGFTHSQTGATYRGGPFAIRCSAANQPCGVDAPHILPDSGTEWSRSAAFRQCHARANVPVAPLLTANS